MNAIAAALAMLPTLAIGGMMAYATAKAVESVARQPEAANKIQQVLLIGLALAESCAVYAFVISLLLSFKA